MAKPKNFPNRIKQRRQTALVNLEEAKERTVRVIERKTPEEGYPKKEWDEHRKRLESDLERMNREIQVLKERISKD